MDAELMLQPCIMYEPRCCQCFGSDERYTLHLILSVYITADEEDGRIITRDSDAFQLTHLSHLAHHRTNERMNESEPSLVNGCCGSKKPVNRHDDADADNNNNKCTLLKRLTFEMKLYGQNGW